MSEIQDQNGPPQPVGEAYSGASEIEGCKLSGLGLVALIPRKLEDIPKLKGPFVAKVLNESDDEIAFVISSPQVHNLMNCCLAEISSDILFVANIEISPHIRGGKGVGVDFYANLSKEAKKLGYRFLTGYHNDPETARFFINRGRYLVEEVKDELRSHFQVLEDQEDDESVLHTIQFLNPEDVDSFIKPERVGTNADSKIEFRGRLNSLLKS